MFDNIDFVYEDGTVGSKEVTVFALSTCGFCRKGLDYLREKSVKFRYIYIDKLDVAVKNDLKAQLQEYYNKRVAFPFLTINNSTALVGFVEKEWADSLFS